MLSNRYPFALSSGRVDLSYLPVFIKDRLTCFFKSSKTAITFWLSLSGRVAHSLCSRT